MKQFSRTSSQGPTAQYRSTAQYRYKVKGRAQDLKAARHAARVAGDERRAREKREDPVGYKERKDRAKAAAEHARQERLRLERVMEDR